MKQIKANDIRVGLVRPLLFKNPKKWVDFKKYERAHKLFHNKSQLFYPTTPMLLEGIIRAFDIQIKRKKINRYAYWEFGVFKGFSLWFSQMYAQCKGIKNLKFYGFDSFKGLPQSKIDNTKPAFEKGHYASPYEYLEKIFKTLEFSTNNLKIFQGFYSNELFKRFKKENKFLPISICTIDVDIYESAVEVLDFIKDYLVPGSIILFDDYNCFLKSNKHGERRALLEFKKKYPNFKFKHLFGFGWHGEAFEVIKI